MKEQSHVRFGDRVSSARTPIGKLSGALGACTESYLGGVAIGAARARSHGARTSDDCQVVLSTNIDSLSDE